MKPSTNKRDYNIISMILFGLVVIGFLLGAINITSFIIMTLIHIYFLYEYNRKPNPLPEELTLNYQDGEPSESIKKLDGKTMKININVVKHDSNETLQTLQNLQPLDTDS